MYVTAVIPHDIPLFKIIWSRQKEKVYLMLQIKWRCRLGHIFFLESHRGCQNKR
jgi:hypothetical protein